MKKKILALFESYSTTGGAEISNSLILDYSTEEYDVEKVFFKSHFLNLLPVNASLFFKVLIWKNPVEKLIQEKNPDLIVTQQHLTVVSSLAVKKRFVPIISFIRDWWFLTPNRDDFEKYATVPHPSITKKGIGVIDFIFSRWTRINIKKALNSVTVVAVSDFVRRKLRKTYGLDAQVLNPPIEKQFFVSNPPVKKKFLSKNIIFIGRITPEKGVDLIIKAMEFVDGKLTIIGGKHGMYTVYCETLANHPKLKGKILFTGKLGPGQTLEYIKKSAAVVVPSLWQEPFGRVNIEAMATGTPVVATRSGGMSESSKNQLLAKSNPKALAQKINLLLRSPEKYSKYAAKAKQDAKKYSLYNIGQQFIKIVKEELGD
jgi:glycosyltransferase involved in cell wall biosynthesis